MDLTPEKFRSEFERLTAERGAIDAALDPLYAELTALDGGETKLSVKQAKAREVEIRAQIIKLKELLVPVETARGMCARALGGKTASFDAPDL
jgi:hypothetical protein